MPCFPQASAKLTEMLIDVGAPLLTVIDMVSDSMITAIYHIESQGHGSTDLFFILSLSCLALTCFLGALYYVNAEREYFERRWYRLVILAFIFPLLIPLGQLLLVRVWLRRRNKN